MLGRITQSSQHQILLLKNKNEQKDDTCGNDESTPTEQENEEKRR